MKKKREYFNPFTLINYLISIHIFVLILSLATTGAKGGQFIQNEYKETKHSDVTEDNTRLAILTKKIGYASTPTSFTQFTLILNTTLWKTNARICLKEFQTHLAQLSMDIETDGPPAGSEFDLSSVAELNRTLGVYGETFENAILDMEVAATKAYPVSGPTKRQLGFISLGVSMKAEADALAALAEERTLETGFALLEKVTTRLMDNMTMLSEQERLDERIISMTSMLDAFGDDVMRIRSSINPISKQQMPFSLVSHQDFGNMLQAADVVQGGKNKIPARAVYNMPVQMAYNSGVIKLIGSLPTAMHIFALHSIEQAYVVLFENPMHKSEFQKIDVYDIEAPDYIGVGVDSPYLTSFKSNELRNCYETSNFYMCKKRVMLHNLFPSCIASLYSQNARAILKQCASQKRKREVPNAMEIIQLSPVEFAFTRKTALQINCTHPSDPTKTYQKNLSPRFRVRVDSYCSLTVQGHKIARVESPHASELSMSFVSESEIFQYITKEALIRELELEENARISELNEVSRMQKALNKTFTRFEHIDKIANATNFLNDLADDLAKYNPIKLVAEGVEKVGGWIVSPVYHVINVVATVVGLAIGLVLVAWLCRIVCVHEAKKRRNKKWDRRARRENEARLAKEHIAMQDLIDNHEATRSRIEGRMVEEPLPSPPSTPRDTGRRTPSTLRIGQATPERVPEARLEFLPRDSSLTRSHDSNIYTDMRRRPEPGTTTVVMEHVYERPPSRPSSLIGQVINHD